MRVGGEVSTPEEISRVPVDLSGVSPEVRGYSVCIMEAVIDRDGAVTTIRTLRPSPVPMKARPVINAIARAVKQWRYKPAVYRGRPVSVYLTVTVTHCLDSE